MSLLLVPPTRAFHTSNFGMGPSTNTFGTTITASASTHTKGDWTQVLAAASVTSEITWLTVYLVETAVAATDTSMLVDIGVKGAGEGDYTVLLADLMGGYASGWIWGAQRFWTVPVRIPSGAAIGARCQAAVSADTCEVVVVASGANSAHEWSGTYSETIGASAADSGGTSVTMGNGSYGSWASIGTTANTLRYWQFCATPQGATVSAGYNYLDFGWGSATTPVVMIEKCIFYANSDEWSQFIHPTPVWSTVPAGSTIYCRGVNASGTPSYDVVAYGVG